MVSVFYRFLLSAIILIAYCRILSLKMRFSLMEHMFMAVQGLFLFAINYWLFYLAEVYITSGLAAVVFSTLVFMNVVNGRILLGSPIQLKVVWGAAIGLAGIGFVFMPELSAFTLSDDNFLGLTLCLLATLTASFGNIASARNQKFNLPIIQTNAYGMAYGATIIGLVGVFSGKTFSFEMTPAYIVSLVYLALFGSVIAFGCYLTLVGRIGADRAAYSTLLFPLVALGFSTVFEGYQWSPAAFAGMALIVMGNFIVIHKKAVV
jgi:drug/metabolite transporter (DMT)-like permease